MQMVQMTVLELWGFVSGHWWAWGTVVAGAAAVAAVEALTGRKGAK